MHPVFDLVDQYRMIDVLGWVISLDESVNARLAEGELDCGCYLKNAIGSVTQALKRKRLDVARDPGLEHPTAMNGIIKGGNSLNGSH